MSKSKPPKAKFAWLAAFVLLLSASAVALGAPILKQQAVRQAQALTTEGDRLQAISPEQAFSDYQIAAWLDPTSTASIKVARLQFQSGRFEDVLRKLKSNQTATSFNLQSKALLELERPNQAVNTVQSALNLEPNDQNRLILALARLQIGESEQLDSPDTSVGSSEALQRLRLAATDKVSLAKLLYDQGLLRSSERALANQSGSSEAYLLLAQIKLAPAKPSRGELDAAKQALQSGLKIDPGNLDLHLLAREVANKMGDRGEADRQTELINQLQTGKL